MDLILSKIKTKFLCGDKPSIADLLIYFEMTNLIYYEKSHEQYKHVSLWFKNVYSIPEVKAIIHEWYPLAQGFIQIYRSVPIVDEK